MAISNDRSTNFNSRNYERDAPGIGMFTDGARVRAIVLSILRFAPPARELFPPALEEFRFGLAGVNVEAVSQL
jgi:hypothetical protein